MCNSTDVLTSSSQQHRIDLWCLMYNDNNQGLVWWVTHVLQSTLCTFELRIPRMILFHLVRYYKTLSCQSIFDFS